MRNKISKNLRKVAKKIAQEKGWPWVAYDDKFVGVKEYPLGNGKFARIPTSIRSLSKECGKSIYKSLKKEYERIYQQ